MFWKTLILMMIREFCWGFKALLIVFAFRWIEYATELLSYFAFEFIIFLFIPASNNCLFFRDSPSTNLPHSDKNLNSNDVPDKVPHPFEHAEELSNSLFFIDGLRSIDFVCVWSTNENDETEEFLTQRRIVFEENLEKEGLHLEREVVKDDLHFIKV